MEQLSNLSVLRGPERDLHFRLLHKVFEENVEKSGGRNTAIIRLNDNDTSDRCTTHNTLNANANRIAACLLKYICEEGQPVAQPNQDGDWIVAVCMPPSDKLITTLLAIWKSGAAYLPIDISLPLNRIEHILNEVKPVLVIHDQYEEVEILSSNKYISFSELQNKSYHYSPGNIDTQNTLCGEQSDLGVVLYTSGSTGAPKGVKLTHSIIQNRLQWQFETFPYSQTEKTGVFKTSLTFVDSVSEIWGPLLNDMAVLIIPKNITKNPERLVEALETYKIERLMLVPTLLRSLLMYLSLKNQPDLLNSLKIWVCSGETLSVSLATEFFDYFQEGKHVLCNFYGSTEITDVLYFICESKMQLQDYEKVPIGYPVNNTVIYILNADYQPVKMCQTGELFVSGLNLARGYVNGRDQFRFIENTLTADPKYHSLYRTGDFASVLPSGVVQYEGRTDSQIKIRGHSVDLSVIETNLLSLDDIDMGIVLCHRFGEIDQTLLAFVTLTNNTKLQVGAQIESVLSSKLAEYMVPQVIIIDSVPLLVNGKVDRQTLLKMYENTHNNDCSDIDFDYTGVPEYQMVMAKNLYAIVNQLGGNSLNSIYTVAQLRTRGYYIGITDFITAKTMHVILNKLSVSDKTDEITTVVNKMQLKSTGMILKHKTEVIEMIALSFVEKGDLEKWLKPSVLYTDYADMLETIFEKLLNQCLSFIVINLNGKMVGVSLNWDGFDEPTFTTNSQLNTIEEFLELVTRPIRDHKLPRELNQIFNSGIMGTSTALSPQENICVIQFMEDEVLVLAKRKGFAGIATTNCSPLTQQIDTHVYGYETLLDYQVNLYVSHDGIKPFGKAPDTQRVLFQWKPI